ncbi:hypothetical protein ABIA13_005335 [Sinorhizobium fredii]
MGGNRSLDQLLFPRPERAKTGHCISTQRKNPLSGPPSNARALCQKQATLTHSRCSSLGGARRKKVVFDAALSYY